MDQLGVFIGEAILILLVSYVLKLVADVRVEMRTLNGRLGTIEEWRVGATKLGDERQSNTERRLGNLEEN